MNISEMKCRMKDYERVDDFVDDLINALFILTIISQNPENYRNNFLDKNKFLLKCYTLLSELYIFRYVYPTLINKNSDIYKMKRVLTIFETLRIEAFNNLFTYLVTQPIGKKFRKIQSYEKHLYNLVCSDSETDKLINVTWVKSMFQFLIKYSSRFLNNSSPHQKNELTFIEAFGKISDILFERINLFHLNEDNKTMQLRNLRALLAIINLLKNAPSESLKVYYMATRVINFLDSHFDSFSREGLEANIELLTMFWSCIKILK